jgi:hypothetical protein
MRHRYFTAEEANALLPTLRPLVAEMVAARDRIAAAEPDLWPVLEKAAGNGGSKKAGAMLADFEKVQKKAKAIQAMGIQVKDINTGLVDFLARRDGRDVLLCWKYDEPSVAHWHDLDSGFAGRRPL